MEQILSLSSRAVFLIGIVLFTFSFLINRIFDNASPYDLFAPLAQAIAHFLSNGIYYLGIGLLVFAVIKFIYEFVIDSY